MSKTLILLFHPDPSRSKTNVAFAEAALALPGAEVVDMQALYPTGVIDTDIEVERLLAADRIVLQFPVQWYSTPPLLKAWQDAVLTRMYYIRPTEGAQLEGTPILVAASAGNTPSAYTATGANLFPLADLLRPLEATANRCGLPWSPPFLTYEADRLDEDGRRAACARYLQTLRNWRADTSVPLLLTA